MVRCLRGMPQDRMDSQLTHGRVKNFWDVVGPDPCGVFLVGLKGVGRDCLCHVAEMSSVFLKVLLKTYVLCMDLWMCVWIIKCYCI